ncbi:MAG: hypothetical protein II000_03155, partial [Clostridia bacterium]|nr:hypothetical protein [Clostridia bacterium]
FDYTQPTYRHELNREEEYVYRRPSSYAPDTSAQEDDPFQPPAEDPAYSLNDRDKDAVFEEMFYDIIHEHGESDRQESAESGANQAPKSIRVKNVPAQQKLRKDSVKRVKSEEQPDTDGKEEGYSDGDE